MTNGIKSLKLVVFVLLLVLLPMVAQAKTVTKEGVTMTYEELGDNSIKVGTVGNSSSNKIVMVFDGNTDLTVFPGSSATFNKVAKRFVKFNTAKSSGPFLWKAPEAAAPVEPQPSVSTPDVATADVATSMTSVKDNSSNKVKDNGLTGGVSSGQTSDDLSLLLNKINHDSFFGQEAVETFAGKCESFSQGLSRSNNKSQFIIDNDIDSFIMDSDREINRRKNEIPALALSLISSSHVSSSYVDKVEEIMNNRVDTREQALKSLKSEVDKANAGESAENPTASIFGDDLINYCIVGGIVLLLIIWMVVAIVKKQKKGKKVAPVADTPVSAPAPTQAEGSKDIVVRRRTTSILKKQNIDDVVNNPAYLLIKSEEFTNDSAVRNIYVKNSCIKEVYNMYAEDLRNSNNPKEDGCMVLGRWVYNEAAHTYDVSLETVVMPGDDAVFKEYELNFGGKIKLRVAEKLRKLRRETNLQYDLVCWIHSHPGLGVFFSNSDVNVQMQLKQPQHPNFLTAFVVDILTSDQDMGIFTFKKDGTMNSKADLTHLFSLEEMYKWALDSEKEMYSPESYFNIIARAEHKLRSCKGIEMNNSSIIDLTQVLVNPVEGISGWVVGTSMETDDGGAYVVSGIVRKADKPSTGVIGALVSAEKFSIPEIQGIVGREDLKFVIVYSPTHTTLTSIPMINGELIDDEQYYAIENIEDLKIWTRRKR